MDTVILRCSLCNREWPFPAAAATIAERRCEICVHAQWARAMRLVRQLTATLAEALPWIVNEKVANKVDAALAAAQAAGIKVTPCEYPIR